MAKLKKTKSSYSLPKYNSAIFFHYYITVLHGHFKRGSLAFYLFHCIVNVIVIITVTVIREIFFLLNTCTLVTSKVQVIPPTRQPSRDTLLIKCLEIGVVIGVAIAF